MVAICDVLDLVVREAAKERPAVLTADVFAEMVVQAAAAMHHGLTDRDKYWVRNAAMNALALHLNRVLGARWHRSDWDIVGAWLANADVSTALDAVTGTAEGLRAGVLQ